MKPIILLILSLCLIKGLYSQNLTQTIRGTIIDEDSRLPIVGATVILLETEPFEGTTTDKRGEFRLENIRIGSVSIEVSYLGYKKNIVRNINLNTAKEKIVDISLKQDAFALQELVVTADMGRGKAMNDLSLISAQSISSEQTSRYAGGFNDPSRITSNYAGVSNTQDGGNDIIVRGNSPKYLQWRLEGIPITNPNHFADQNAVSGVLSTLNNNLVSTSDFYTGAFQAEYGNALSGVYDVHLRKGNNEQFEGTASLGLLGTDITLEGPFSKEYGGSYLINYRYSTIGLISDLGLIDLDGILSFQDAAYKIWLPTKHFGTFSLFGIGGKSNFEFDDVDPNVWITPGNNAMQEDITEDYNKDSQLLNTGLNHLISLTENSYLKTSLIYSSETIKDNIFDNLMDMNTVQQSTLNFQSNLVKNTFRINSDYNLKISPQHKIRIGIHYNQFNYDMTQSLLGNYNDRIETLDFDESIGLLNSYISWKYDISNDLTFVGGIHNSNVLYNQNHTLEPRAALKFKPTENSSMTFGYGNHSTMESIPNYFSQVTQTNGSIITPNLDLEMLRAHHLVIGYERSISNTTSLKVETYYQHLYNLPVENDINSSYSTLNEGLAFRDVGLVNRGTGKNYGVELTLERHLYNHFYFLLNATIYESKYTALDNVERNTMYNGHFLSNFLIGKDFPGLGKKENQIFAINAKAFYGGAKNTTPLLRDENNQLAVNPQNASFYDHQNAFGSRLDNTYNITLNLSYKWNKPSTTHELYLSIDNLTNSQARLMEYYDASEPDNIGYQKQVGIFPNLLYRLYF